MPEPRTFFAVGVHGAPLSALAAAVNGRAAAFALRFPHRAGIGADNAIVQAAWRGVHCKECPNVAPLPEVYEMFERFIIPVTDAHFWLGGYVETWHGDAMDHQLLVRNIPLCDVWLCVLAHFHHATHDDCLQSRLCAMQSGLQLFAERAGGVVIDRDTIADEAAMNRILGVL